METGQDPTPNNTETINERKLENSVNDKRSHTVVEPIDLTFSQKHFNDEKHPGMPGTTSHKSDVATRISSDGKIYDDATLTIARADHLYASANIPKKRGRKRKAGNELQARGAIQTTPYDNPDYVHTMDSRQVEVLLAAKSLFSKRTRTLYHWMYPNTSKALLKSAVTMSWDTLGVQEKEFYISQVLGRFGFPQSSLMVNPQLGGLRGVAILPPSNLVGPMSHLNTETHQAVSTLLEGQENEGNPSWVQYSNRNYPSPRTKTATQKRDRLGRQPGSRSHKHQQLSVKSVNVENEDFQDDPELRQEFEQFKWALHVNK